jgi:hypothetical protein
LVDSAKTVLARNGGDTVLDLNPDGTATAADFIDAANAEGINALFAQKDMFYLSQTVDFTAALADWRGPMPNIGVLRDMIQFCLKHNVTLTLILGSSHADQLETFRQAGLWPYVEQLKIELAQLVDDAHSDGVTAWDFVEYAPYTTEIVPLPGDRVTRLRWFWESVHFTRALGDIMLQRVFRGTPGDFGAPLTMATVDARNRFVRDQQHAFVGWRLACQSARPAPCPIQFGASPVASTADAKR